MAVISRAGTHSRLPRPSNPKPGRQDAGSVLVFVVFVMTATSVAQETTTAPGPAPGAATGEADATTPRAAATTAADRPPAPTPPAPLPDPPEGTDNKYQKQNAKADKDPKQDAPPATEQLIPWMWPALAVAGTLAMLLSTWWAIRYRSSRRGKLQAAAFTDFLDLFFGPMVEDGTLASDEFAPLAAAYFALGVEPSSDTGALADPKIRLLQNDLRQGMQKCVKEIFGPPDEIRAERRSSEATRPQLAKRLVAAWRRMNLPSAISRLTLADRDALLRWIDEKLEDWKQQTFLEELRTLAQAQSQAYLEKHIGKNYPNEGDRRRVRMYFDAAARLLALLNSPDEDEPDADCSSAEPSEDSTPSVVDRAPRPADGTTSASTAGGSSAPRVESMPPPAEPAAAETVDSVEPARSVGEPPAASPVQASPALEPARLPQLVREDLTAKYAGLEATAAAYAADRCRALRGQAKDILWKVEKLFGDFTKPAESPLAFSAYRSLGTGHVSVVTDSIDGQSGKVWFLGDIHGDLLALDAVIDYIDGLCPDATIVFLGDLFDDEGFGYEVVIRVFQLVAERPGRIGYIVGNHDVSLNCNDAVPVTFSSSVSPSDFADFLNAHREDPVACGVGQFAIRFFRSAPRAIFLPDGLVVVHGGVPLGIRFPSIAVPADLERAECLQDFVWTRAHERARKKIPNPTSKTSEFGFEDFSAFCNHVSSTLGIPATSMVRGHDHFEACHSIYERWTRNPCLTVNTLSRRLPRDPFGPFERTPCVARWLAAEPLEIHQLVIPSFLVQAFYGKQPPAADGIDHGSVGT